MTRIAVISDIHGNAVALDAALADIERGGSGSGRLPRRRDPGWRAARADRGALARPRLPRRDGQRRRLAPQRRGKRGKARRSAKSREAVRQWSLAQLSEADRAYIAAFTPTVIAPLTPERDLLCFHGSPHLLRRHPPAQLAGGGVRAAAGAIRTCDHVRRPHPLAAGPPRRRDLLLQSRQRWPRLQPQPARRSLPPRSVGRVRHPQRERWDAGAGAHAFPYP